ncbi:MULTISPECIES: tetratricopeptide repeat protein [unclassified Microcoleus]|uniref:tetratricopeptide repeat protein n=1 Tax=unclassified Microcoleus TaxID=2642155 RepID=UPI002FD051F5
MSRVTATCLVQLNQPTGVEMNAYLVLDEKLTRQDIKLKTLSKYVEQHPTGWKKRRELAELLYAMGNWQQAVEEYRQVLQRQPQLIDVKLLLGKILQLMGKETEAIAVYETAKSLSDNEAVGHHINGLIAVCRRCIEQAAVSFEQATFLEPENTAHWLALGLIYLEKEAPIAALQAFDRVLQLNPNDVVANSHSYDALMMLGNFQEAEQRLQRVLEVFPQDLRSLKLLADSRCGTGLVGGEEGKRTKQMIQTMLRIAPNAAYVHDSLAQYHLFRGEWKKGVAVLQEFVEQHPLNLGGWYFYGRCLFRTGNSITGAEAMLKAYRLYPNDGEIYRALCEILPVAGRGDELKPLVEEMLERFPERWSVWATAGRVLVEHFQDMERGCALSARGMQLQPQLADAWFRHGRVLALAGRHREAVDVLEQGWQLLLEGGGCLQSVPAAVWLGESYRVLGEEEKCRGWLEKGCVGALELMSFNPGVAHYWCGRALSGLGDVAGAVQNYRDALGQHLFYPARGEVKEGLESL